MYLFMTSNCRISPWIRTKRLDKPYDIDFYYNKAWLPLALCDHCRQESGMGYYIAILRLWYCKECYEEWSRIATIRFRGDIPAEERNYREMIDRLKPK